MSEISGKGVSLLLQNIKFMKAKKLKYLFLPLCLVTLTTACSQQEEGFTVSGQIADADDKMLYFEALSLNGVQKLDSTKLDSDGDFSFHGARPENPEFYRIRLGEQIINLAVDSTEEIHITANAADMGAKYSVEGSGNCITLQKIGQKQMNVEKEIRQLVKIENMTLGEKERRITDLVHQYKEELKKDFILNNPAAPSSYFALFQTIHGELVFDPVNDADDVRWFAAVATAWDNLYPGCARSENLKNITLQGQRNTRRPKQIDVEITNEKIRATGIIDLSLKDINGQTRNLSDLRGKVVLLDFTAYALPTSKERIMEMRQLYQDYHDRGLEIYQVSVDAGEHYWKTVSDPLPWICVFDPQGTASDNLLLYNVQELPSSFLIDRNSDLKCRITPDTNTRQEIEKLL